MSVLKLDVDVCEAVYNKAVSYTFRNQVDINYCSTLGRFTKTDLQEIIKSWFILNELSYNGKYKDISPSIVDLITFRTAHSINTYQMLKYMECIRYNIEPNTIKRNLNTFEEQSLKVLNDAIDEIKSIIINELEEYKKSRWSSLY